MSRLLDDEEITRALADLPGWVRDEDTIQRMYEAADFPTAIRIVDEVARDAEEMDHHPDIDIRWRTVAFTCSTHSKGGLTQLDVELAHRIDDVIARTDVSPGDGRGGTHG
jgi:4a-hydroxytetrahydrobiopterin dehydratase